MNEQRLYTGPINTDKGRKLDNVWSKWLGAGVTLLIALFAFISGYSALRSDVQYIQKNYVTLDQWRNGFIEWTGWRSGVAKDIANIEANVTLLQPSAPRYSRPDAEKDHDRLVRMIEDIERQVDDLHKRVDECAPQ